MQLTYNNKDYEVVIERKKGQRNTYIRVKKDLKTDSSILIFLGIIIIALILLCGYYFIVNV